MNEDKTTKDVLIEARDNLITNGINRDGNYVNKATGESCCALGAIYVAQGARIDATDSGKHFLNNYGTKLSLAPRNSLYSALRELHPKVSCITDLNDQSNDDSVVIAVFDKAIESYAV